MIDAKSLIEMLESSYDGIWITDGNGRILFANSANASLLGVTKEDLMGKSTEELLEKRSFPTLCALRPLSRSGRPLRFATTIIRS
ncbi:MAG: PAS domain-containing protein [Dysosmobacter welbionis]|uniref:PAS domain-containing protein n=1 Tax=Dysosmobacter welbionis TaxID=2093857 RepID=UPI0039940CBE